jgi:hypothetical protein
MLNYEICATNYSHPDITIGQHTNGPARVWVKVDGIWIDTGSTKLHKVLRELERNGPDRIIAGAWDEYGNNRQPLTP